MKKEGIDAEAKRLAERLLPYIVDNEDHKIVKDIIDNGYPVSTKGKIVGKGARHREAPFGHLTQFDLSVAANGPADAFFGLFDWWRMPLSVWYWRDLAASLPRKWSD